MSWQQSVALAVEANVPTVVWGDPGIGKTSFVYTLGEALNLPVEVVIASLREPSDFLGLPVVAGDGIKMAPPQWALRLQAAGKGLLVFDEITTAPPSVQAALLRVVLERVVGDLTLPPGVRVIAIANPGDQAGGWDLSLPLSNRFFHVKAKAATAQEWGEGMMNGWPRPEVAVGRTDSGEQQRAKTLVAGFLRARPELLLQVPKNEARDNEGWPSPRSWEMASKLLSVSGTDRVAGSMVASLVGGCVGPGTGLEFAGWMEKLDLPEPLALLREPEAFKADSRADINMVILNNVMHTALPLLEEQEGQRFYEATWAIMAKIADVGMPDVCVAPAKKLAQAGREHGLITPHKSVKSLGPILAAIS